MTTGKALADMDVRDMEINPGDAVNVSDTMQLNGLARDTISWTETNDTGEYVNPGGSGKGAATGRH